MAPSRCGMPGGGAIAASDPRDDNPHVMIAGEIERRRRVQTRVGAREGAGRVGRFPGGAKNPRRLGKSVPLNAPRRSAAERARAARTASAGETGGSPIQREGARPACWEEGVDCQVVDGRRRRGGEAKKNRKVARFFPRGGSRRSRAAGRGSDAARARSGWLRTLICMVMSSMRAWLLMASELSKRCADSRLLVRLRVNRPTTPFSFLMLENFRGV